MTYPKSIAVLLAVAMTIPAAAVAFDAERHLDLQACRFVDPAELIDCAKHQREQCQKAVDALSLSTAEGVYACGPEYFSQADLLLNETYRVSITKAQHADKEWADSIDREDMLRIAQRAWISYRDATCQIRADWHRIGSGYDSAIADCAADLSLHQIQVLVGATE